MFKGYEAQDAYHYAALVVVRTGRDPSLYSAMDDRRCEWWARIRSGENCDTMKEMRAVMAKAVKAWARSNGAPYAGKVTARSKADMGVVAADFLAHVIRESVSNGWDAETDRRVPGCIRAAPELIHSVANEYTLHSMAGGTALVSSGETTVLVKANVDYVWSDLLNTYSLTARGFAKLCAAL